MVPDYLDPVYDTVTVPIPCINKISYALSPQHDTVSKAITPLTVTLGGCTPDSLTVTPALQIGLSMSHSTGTITGTPSAAGTLNYTVWAWGSAHTDSASAAVQLIVAAAGGGSVKKHRGAFNRDFYTKGAYTK